MHAVHVRGTVGEELVLEHLGAELGHGKRSGVLSDYSDLRCLNATMNIVQKIDTGGTSNTSTPMLKLRINELFPPIEARHIAH